MTFLPMKIFELCRTCTPCWPCICSTRQIRIAQINYHWFMTLAYLIWPQPICMWDGLMKLAGYTIRYLVKTLEKTRALYPSWLGCSTPTKWIVVDFKMSKTSKISVLDFRGPYGTLKLVSDYVLHWKPYLNLSAILKKV